MSRLVLLDAGPLGLAANPRTTTEAERCRDWIKELVAAGVEVVIPEIADYEIRRQLVMNALPKTRPAILKRLATLPGKPTPGLQRLDLLKADLSYLPLSTAAMLKAAEFWAVLRRVGATTAGPWDLDADAILAGQAATAGRLGDVVTIATTNVRHLGRFPGIEAQTWSTIR